MNADGDDGGGGDDDGGDSDRERERDDGGGRCTGDDGDGDGDSDDDGDGDGEAERRLHLNLIDANVYAARNQEEREDREDALHGVVLHGGGGSEGRSGSAAVHGGKKREYKIIHRDEDGTSPSAASGLNSMASVREAIKSASAASAIRASRSQLGSHAGIV